MFLQKRRKLKSNIVKQGKKKGQRERERPFFRLTSSSIASAMAGALVGTSGRSNLSSSSGWGGTAVGTSGRSWTVICTILKQFFMLSSEASIFT